MIVELILSGVFFLLCFNDQLGGWFSAATHDGGGGLRSLASGEAGWAALLVASDVRLGGSRAQVPVGEQVGRPPHDGRSEGSRRAERRGKA